MYSKPAGTVRSRLTIASKLQGQEEAARMQRMSELLWLHCSETCKYSSVDKMPWKLSLSYQGLNTF